MGERAREEGGDRDGGWNRVRVRDEGEGRNEDRDGKR